MLTILAASLDGVIRILAACVAVVALCGCGSSDKPATTAAGTAATQPATTSNGARVIDGIRCQPEHLESHYHAHLELLRDGHPVQVPALIGIDLQHQCLYWLHTHDTTGVMHIESPDSRTYTLGQFFDVWGKPLSRTRAASLNGALKVFVGQKPVNGDPRAIVLKSHELITIEQGRTVTPPGYHFAPGL
jgi:hypothetical protein